MRADIEAWVVRYLERITNVRTAPGAVVMAGRSDVAEAMRRGPLMIRADEAKELLPGFAADNRSRSEHSASVHTAAMAACDRSRICAFCAWLPSDAFQIRRACDAMWHR